LRIEMSREAVEFIRAHGGKLWVWAARPKMCCGGTPAYMHAATEPPLGVHGFEPVPSADVDVRFRAPGGRMPEFLEVAIHGKRHPRVEAYWEGCLIAL
jgi:hypothetical protein